MENIPTSFQILAHSVTDFGITRIRQSCPCRMASDALIFNTKPLSRLTGCGRLIRIIAPPVPLFSATRTVGSPLYSIRGREEVSLCPRRLIAPCRHTRMMKCVYRSVFAISAPLHPPLRHMGSVPVSSYGIVNVQRRKRIPSLIIRF